MGKLSYNDMLRIQTLPEQGLGEKAIVLSLTKGGSWALLRKSAVESTALAQPFCVNQAVWDLPQRLHAQFVVVRQFFSISKPYQALKNSKKSDSYRLFTIIGH